MHYLYVHVFKAQRQRFLLCPTKLSIMNRTIVDIFWGQKFQFQWPGTKHDCVNYSWIHMFKLLSFRTRELVSIVVIFVKCKRSIWSLWDVNIFFILHSFIMRNISRYNPSFALIYWSFFCSVLVRNIVLRIIRPLTYSYFLHFLGLE